MNEDWEMGFINLGAPQVVSCDAVFCGRYKTYLSVFIFFKRILQIAPSFSSSLSYYRLIYYSFIFNGF